MKTSKKKEIAKKMVDRHAKMADELNARNRANPKKYQRYLEESHRIAAEGRPSTD